MARNAWLIIIGVILLAAVLAFFVFSGSPTNPNTNNPSSSFAQSYAPVSTKAQQLNLSSDGKINVSRILDLQNTELVEFQSTVEQTPNQTGSATSELRDILLLVAQATQTRLQLLAQITTIENIPPGDYCQNLPAIEKRETLSALMISQLEEVKTKIETFTAQYPAESNYTGINDTEINLSAYKDNQSQRETLLEQTKKSCEANSA